MASLRAFPALKARENIRACSSSLRNYFLHKYVLIAVSGTRINLAPEESFEIKSR